MRTIPTSTPIVNLIGSEVLHTLYQQWGYFGSVELIGVPPSEWPARFPQPHESGVEYAKRMLGPQTLCKGLARRNWIWIRPKWVLFASKRGLTFEVRIDESFRWEDRETNERLALEAWGAFMQEWGSV